MDHYLTTTEYLKLIRSIAGLIKFCEHETLHTLLIELCNIREEGDIYAISEQLMARIAIVHMCDMALIQYRDTNGEIDYACLGRHSLDMLNGIIRGIYYFVP